MKKIISLTKVFTKEFYQNLAIFDRTKKKFNKKSIFFWMLAIIFLGVSYVSYEIIVFLKQTGQPEIFLKIYFFILAIVMALQAILVCANIFFFSKDMEKVLPMPIKPAELLVAKFNTLLSMLYVTEAMIALVPFTLYRIIDSCKSFILCMGNYNSYSISDFASYFNKYHIAGYYAICKIC